MESQPQNPEFRNHPENFHPCIYAQLANFRQESPKLVLLQTMTTQMKCRKMHNVAFHQGLHCLLCKINLQRNKYNFFFNCML